MTATVFSVAQSLIFFLYAAGYVFGAYLVVEGRNSYEEIFRYVCNSYEEIFRYICNSYEEIFRYIYIG